MVSSVSCWNPETLFQRALVLPNGKNLARNALEHLSQVDTASLLEQNHCFTFPRNENGKRQRRTTSWDTPHIVNVLQISKKSWRWASASSEALLQNGLCCTMLMRAGLSSKLPSPMFISRPILTLELDGADKSLMHLQVAINAGSCGGGDPWNLSTISRTWDPKDPDEESLERDFLIRDYGSEW
jgi:hypothetical protein